MKKLLKKMPLAYQGAQKIYYACFAFLELVFGTRLQEWRWKLRHAIRKSHSASAYRDTLDHPHRQFLVNKICERGPISRMLEIGCGAGPNLILLSRALPSAHFFGIDINTAAIAEGKKWIAQLGMNNISLFKGRADDIKKLPDKSIDCVFSDAILMYIGPDKIQNLVSECLRIASKRIFFLEYHSSEISEKGFFYDGHWIYNYRALFYKYVDKECVTITPLLPDVWDSPGWKRYGALVEITL